ncbi:MAG: hypothetical protein U9R60_02430, partial [Bacteroidota bacterium]|nr:hypothetical protein [Bacteroidota bacterium]
MFRLNKLLLITILCALVFTGTAEARNLDSPDILKFYARLNIDSDDTSGHGATPTDTSMTYTGETPWGAGAGVFSGTGYIDCGTATGISLGDNTTKITLSCWIKADSVASGKGILEIGTFAG